MSQAHGHRHTQFNVLLHCSANQISAECCLAFATPGGYRKFLGCLGQLAPTTPPPRRLVSNLSLRGPLFLCASFSSPSQGEVEGGGFSVCTKSACTKMAPSHFPNGKLRFSHEGHFGGLKWSGCVVRIRLWPRLPHGCHRLPSMSHMTALPQCLLVQGPALGHASAGCTGFLGSWVMHASRSRATPSPCCFCSWPHLATPFGLRRGFRLKTPVGTGW